MSHLVFTYGTLMFPEVMQAVCGQRFNSQPAVLKNFQLIALHDRVYPGIIPAPGVSCEGLLHEGIDDDCLAVLDSFEGHEYGRQVVDVECGGETRQAWTYVITEAYRSLASSDNWNSAEFSEKHLKKYLEDVLA